MSQRPGFMLYFDIEPALSLLDDSQCGKLFRAIVEYAHYATIPEFEEKLTNMAWSLIRPNLDRDRMSYDKRVHENKIKGLKSDFRRNFAPKNGIDPEDEVAMNEYIRQRLSTVADQSQQIGTATLTKTSAEPSRNITTSCGKTKAGARKGSGEGEDRFTPHTEQDLEKIKRERINSLRDYKG